jgi:hypothetical protein
MCRTRRSSVRTTFVWRGHGGRACVRHRTSKSATPRTSASTAETSRGANASAVGFRMSPLVNSRLGCRQGTYTVSVPRDRCSDCRAPDIRRRRRRRRSANQRRASRRSAEGRTRQTRQRKLHHVETELRASAARVDSSQFLVVSPQGDRASGPNGHLRRHAAARESGRPMQRELEIAGR